MHTDTDGDEDAKLRHRRGRKQNVLGSRDGRDSVQQQVDQDGEPYGEWQHGLSPRRW
jgi:hypothetical protein